MQKYEDYVLDRRGNVVPGATITVKTYPANELAAIYTANGTGLISPAGVVTADDDGKFWFYAANGRYSYTASGFGISVPVVKSDIVLYDVEDDVDRAFDIVEFGGADPTGSTSVVAAVQATVLAAEAVGGAVIFPDGTFLFDGTVTCTKKWVFKGNGAASIIKVTSETVNPFTFNINTTTIENWEISGLHFRGPLTANPLSIALKFTGDNVATCSNGICNVSSYGFATLLKDEKSPRTTAYGLEGMLNWNRFDNTIVNPGLYGYWYANGSGTGNIWNGITMMLNAGSACMFFDGSGCVVGDIIVGGQFGCQAAGGIGLKIGADTVYRSNIDVCKVAFDANCDIPLSLSATGSIPYSNIKTVANNIGGASVLGSGLVPLINSTIHDRDVSEWKAGVSKTSASTGLQSADLFEITFGPAGVARFRVSINGSIGGVGYSSSYAEYIVADSTAVPGALTIQLLESYVDLAAGFEVSVVDSTGRVATVSATFTPSSSGSPYNSTIAATGRLFKIERV